MVNGQCDAIAILTPATDTLRDLGSHLLSLFRAHALLRESLKFAGWNKVSMATGSSTKSHSNQTQEVDKYSRWICRRLGAPAHASGTQVCPVVMLLQRLTISSSSIYSITHLAALLATLQYQHGTLDSK